MLENEPTHLNTDAPSEPSTVPETDSVSADVESAGTGRADTRDVDTPQRRAETAAEDPAAPVGPSGSPALLFQAPPPPDPGPDQAPRRRRAASRPAGEPRAVSSGAVNGGAGDQAGFPESGSASGESGPGRTEAAGPESSVPPERDTATAASATTTTTTSGGEPRAVEESDTEEPAEQDDVDTEAGETGTRRRRRRGGRGRRGRPRTDGEADANEWDDSRDTGEEEGAEPADRSPRTGGDRTAEQSAPADRDDQAVPTGDEAPNGTADGEKIRDDSDTGVGRRRRRRRRRAGEEIEPSPDDPEETVVRVRDSRPGKADDEVSSVRGSTRLEAKKQRRREGREAGRRRPPIITESEFLARRESVERVMVVRQIADRTQIAVLEDGVLAEHYVSRTTSSSLIGNVFLGRVQNVLPSMEAAFVDIGKGRNAVLYAGEVNFDAVGLDGQPRRIEHALKSGQSVLVQVTKDPVGHKGARLTSQISLPGRYLVYVPEGSMTGISRKLPDTERARLKGVLKKVVSEDAGVIIRTAAEGATEDELARDVSRLAAQWEDIQTKAKTASAPALLYGEPDLTIRVVRDIFNEDFTTLVVSGAQAQDMVESYVSHVAPDLSERLTRWTSEADVFAAYRIDEQIAKALDRKVWLPSGGSLVIDRTEAMTVIDVNTGKFTGQGGNLEETVTKNNIEAAEEIVRQLRLRDIGGIIVIDFIDMVLETNRDLVLRRLLECLGRDRTKHQVAEVTSLGLVQMTRKRVGQGLLEAFSETCEICGGRGVIVRMEPMESKPPERTGRSERRRRRGRGGDQPAELGGAVEAEAAGAMAITAEPVAGAWQDESPADQAMPTAELPAPRDADEAGSLAEVPAPRDADEAGSLAEVLEPDVEEVLGPDVEEALEPDVEEVLEPDVEEVLEPDVEEVAEPAARPRRSRTRTAAPAD